MKRPTPQHALLGAILAFVAVWGAAFVWETSFVFRNERFFCLFDDAMISMTYARNLLEGHGLNWARHGDPVEGYTSPVWVGVMVGVHALPIALSKTSLVIQGISLLCLLLATGLVARLTCRHFRTGPGSVWWPAALLTALWFPLAYWTLRGMETGLQALLAIGAVSTSLELAEGRGGAGRLFAVCCACLLLRLDMALVVLAVGVFLAWRGPLRPSRARRWLPAALLASLPLVAYTVFRLAYFGDWLPNPYYLKMTGIDPWLRIQRGALVFFDFARPLWPLLVLGLSAGVVALRSLPALALPLGVFALFAGYSIHVGGDAWEQEPIGANRFLAVGMPFLFVALNAGANRLLFPPHAELPLRQRRLRNAALVPVVVGCAAVSLGVLAEDFDERWRLATLRSRHLGAANEMNVRKTLLTRRVVGDGAVVAVVWAGTPAYFSDWKLVDVLGFNDRTVARGPARTIRDGEPRSYVPGHAKYDFEYSFGELAPDVVLQTWRQEMFPAMRKHGYELQTHTQLWVRSDSRYVRKRRPRRRRRP